MLNKEKELLLQLLMEKYQEDDGCVCCTGNVSSYSITPEEWERCPSGNPMVTALSRISGVSFAYVEYSTRHRLRIHVVGGHPQDIAEAIVNLRGAGVVLANGNYSVDVKRPGFIETVTFNYIRG